MWCEALKGEDGWSMLRLTIHRGKTSGARQDFIGCAGRTTLFVQLRFPLVAHCFRSHQNTTLTKPRA